MYIKYNEFYIGIFSSVIKFKPIFFPLICIPYSSMSDWLLIIKGITVKHIFQITFDWISIDLLQIYKLNLFGKKTNSIAPELYNGY